MFVLTADNMRKAEEAAEGDELKSVNGKTSSKNGDETKSKKEKPKGPQKLKFTYMEQKEYETIESDIASLEEELEQLEQEMMQNATNSFKLSELTAKQEEVPEKQDIEEIKAFILDKYHEWKATGYTHQAVRNKESFSREKQAEQFEQLFIHCIEQHRCQK